MAKHVPIGTLNRILKAGEKRVDDLEPRLVDILEPILTQAGVTAAANFRANATNHLTAAALAADRTRLAALGRDGTRALFPSLVLTGAAGRDHTGSNSTMIALKPLPEEAAKLAAPDGVDPDTIHVTLAYLGPYDGDLALIAHALADVAKTHAPLEGRVGGIGSFADNGNGHPAIYLPSVPGLIELRVAVTEALVEAEFDYGREHGYLPHMTISYEDSEMTLPSPENFNEPLHFDEILIVRGDTDVVALPLDGMPPVTASAYEIITEEDLQPNGMRCSTCGYLFEVGDKYASVPLGATFWEIVCAACAPPDCLVAAGEPTPWSAPAPNEVIDVPSLVSTLRGKTDPVRVGAVEAIMSPALAEAGLDFDVTNPFTAKVLEQSGSQITEIAKTTQLNVMRIIKASHDEGLSIPATATAIQSGMAEASTARATLIARTELVGAVNGGSLAATRIISDATGQGYIKVWLTAPGAQFPRHEDYDGLDEQKQPLDAPFDVGADQLQFPGDPSGDPGEVCNCRCTMVYEDAGGQEVAETDADQGEIDVEEIASGGGGDGGLGDIVEAAAPPEEEGLSLAEADVQTSAFETETKEMRRAGQPFEAAEDTGALSPGAAAQLQQLQKDFSSWDLATYPQRVEAADTQAPWYSRLASVIDRQPVRTDPLYRAMNVAPGAAGDVLHVPISDWTHNEETAANYGDHVLVLKPSRAVDQTLIDNDPASMDRWLTGGNVQIEKVEQVGETTYYRARQLDPPGRAMEQLAERNADTISVGPGEPVPPSYVKRIKAMKLDQPVVPGPVAKSILGDAKDTQHLYIPDGVWNEKGDLVSGSYVPERAELHDGILNHFFDGKVPPANPADRQILMTSGGGASGKSGATFEYHGRTVSVKDIEEHPADFPDVIVVNPDWIKEALPEYLRIRDAGDPAAAGVVHEESSQLAKQLYAKASEEGYSILLDTTGSSGSFIGKIDDAVKEMDRVGGHVQLTMISAPTNDAIVRSVVRGDKNGRYLNMAPLKDAHRGASAQLAKWKEKTGFAWKVIDTGGPEGAPNVLVAEGDGTGKIVVYDQAKWEAILAKADEPNPFA